MLKRPLLSVCSFLLASSAFAQDDQLVETNCPSYPAAQRAIYLDEISLQRDVELFSKRKGKNAAARTVASNNFIDDFIFGKMVSDGVESALVTTDAEFVRRVTLDLTGRIPEADTIEAFLADKSAGKRQALIALLMASDGFVDNWTLFLGNKFQVTNSYYNNFGIVSRNLFYRYVRDAVKKDKPYNDLVRELIGSRGISSTAAPVNFIVRGWQEGDPIQDTWDALTNQVTTKFLGVRTECVSCHDGRRHLEPINLYLAARKRIEFWGMSAFFSRLNLIRVQGDAYNQEFDYNVTDRGAGGYHSTVPSNNPGPRPPRVNGPYTPKYILTGEEPQSGEWRQEFARMLVSDRQFARASVNYLWAFFFSRGIVDPPDGWDLNRLDAKNPPPAGWPLQVSHPELLEALTDQFIQNNYSIQSIIKIIVESNAYQLSSRYAPGKWKPVYAAYFAKHTPRRLSAEEIYDAISVATATQVPLYVQGFDQPVYFASQLPDPTEPRYNYSVRNTLHTLGRGDWWTIANRTTPDILQTLYLMNEYQIVGRAMAQFPENGSSSVAKLVQSNLSEAEAIKQLFLRTLGRKPTDEEIQTLNAMRKGTRTDWLSDVQWVLMNKLDFLFNY